MRLRVRRVQGSLHVVPPANQGLRHYGVPPGGPFDRMSAAIALALVGAERGTVLELALGRAEFEVEEGGLLGVAGAPSQVLLGGIIARSQCSFEVRSGDSLEVRLVGSGARVYIAGAGDFDSPRGQFELAEPISDRVVGWSGGSIVSAKHDLAPRAPGHLRIHLYAPKSIFHAFQVTTRLDRVGVRLEGTRVEPGPEMVSEPSWPGLIQIANDGNLIIHGPDGPTIGGYTRFGTVIDTDLDHIGQLQPGNELTFVPVSLDEALAAREDYESQKRAIVSQILSGRG